MTLFGAWLILCGGLCAIMALAWWLQYLTQNSGWADVSWSLGTGLTGFLLALWPLSGEAEVSNRQILVAILVAIWSIRLGFYIHGRTKGGPEDARYAKLRETWGVNFQTQLFRFLQIQAVAAFPLILTMGVAAHQPAAGLRLADCLGALALLVAILGEGLADDQLRRFKRDPSNKGRVCDVGLWRWSRHPNYFFEWFGWLAYPVIALSGGYAWGWASLLGPALIYVLLVYVSGIPPLEEHMLASRGELFRAYQRRTSPFFPLPPKRIAP